MNLLLNLYLSFFKIGLFGFGGGYAMISLIQKELEIKGWLSMKKFVDIIAIAEMTPGPIAINSGTFVGFNIMDISGSVMATLGVITPSFILVLILAHFFKKVKESKYIDSILQLLRPAVIGLIISAAFVIARSCMLELGSVVITGATLLLMYKTKIHPILIIIMAGFSGIIIYG